MGGSGMIFCSQSFMIHLQSFSALTKTKFGNQNVPLKEITDGRLLFASARNLHYPVVSCKQADGYRRDVSPQSSGQGRIPKGNQNKGNQTSSKSPGEIISLFKRIQSSISKESVSSKKRSSNTSEDENGPLVESVLEVLRKSRAKVKGTTATKERDKILARQRGSLRKERKANESSLVESNLTRRPSSFVRRSPIPPSNQGLQVNLRSEELPAKDDDKEMKIPEGKKLALQSVEALKLPELKELAKSRGIKGYSKLRKAELVKLLVTL